MKSFKLLPVLFLLGACSSGTPEYDATGTFEATEVIVSAEASGKILGLDVEEGTTLKAGQEVGIIDTVQLYLKKLQLEASAKSVEGQRPDILKQVAATKEQILQAQRERDRVANLLRVGAANQKQLDDAESLLKVLRKQLTAQNSTLRNSDQSLTWQSSSVGIQVAQLEDQLKKCHIISPLTGTVLAKYAEAGELAAPGTPLFKIADMEQIYLRAYITSEQLSEVQLGQKVTVYSDYGKDVRKEYPGIVIWISDSSEFTPKTILTKDERAKKVFYTAMYHAFIAPTLYCDANGDFRGHDDKVYTNNTWKNYSTFSLWDTYRTLHPLFTIIKPQYVSDLVNSMLSIYDQQEKLPIWPLIGGETDQMPGYSAVPIIADAYLKGFTGFDADRAYRYMVASSVYEKQNGVPYVLEKGYIPCDKVREATSIAMEYAADDWGIALMAKKMGKTEDYQNYLKRGKYYTQYFDKDINFIRPKMNDGSWRTPYDPIQSIHSVGDFCEGNGWHYTFFVPQHPEGLIELMGGDAPFISKLDSLFLVEGELGENASPDISGLIGMYAHGNEPSHHVTYLYPYAGEQWKTAEKVRYIQDVFYTDQPEGIIGNEDCGQMSAWHIMSALGFYQVNPSNGVFVFGSPLFDKASVHLPEGKTFEVVAQNNSKENVYIQSVLLNGKPYNNSYILYDDIVKGGNLTFVMGNTPNKEFGAAPENRPKTAE